MPVNASTPCLSLWERWLSEAKTEMGQGCNTLSVTFGDSSPRGRAKGLYQYSGADVLRQGQRKATISLDFSKKTNTMDAYCFP